MLDEKRFIGNPEAELRSLLELSDHEIESKLRHLAFAQKVTMLDHPESLFVPAFLREAVNAFKSSSALGTDDLSAIGLSKESKAEMAKPS